MVYEILGFLFLCAANLYFSAIVSFMFLYGGGDLGPLLTGWVNWKNKLLGVVFLLVNLLVWYILYINAPFHLSMN